MLLIFPLFAGINLSRLSQYAACAAGSVATLRPQLPGLQAAHVRTRLPTLRGLLARFCGGLVFQVCGSVLFVLCWWLPASLVLTAMASKVPDVTEVQVAVWVGLGASVLVALLCVEPLRSCCRWAADAHPSTALGATGRLRVNARGEYHAAPANGLSSFNTDQRLNMQSIIKTLAKADAQVDRNRGQGRVCCWCWRRPPARSNRELGDVLEDADGDAEYRHSSVPSLPGQAGVLPRGRSGSDGLDRVSLDSAAASGFEVGDDLSQPLPSQRRVASVSSQQRQLDWDRYMAQLNTSEQTLLTEVSSEAPLLHASASVSPRQGSGGGAAAAAAAALDRLGAMADESDTLLKESEDEVDVEAVAVRARALLHRSESTRRVAIVDTGGGGGGAVPSKSLEEELPVLK